MHHLNNERLSLLNSEAAQDKKRLEEIQARYEQLDKESRNAGIMVSGLGIDDNDLITLKEQWKREAQTVKPTDSAYARFNKEQEKRQ